MSLLQELAITLTLTTTILALISILMFRRGWIGPASDWNVHIEPSEDEEPFNMTKALVIVGSTIVIAIVLSALVIYLP